MQFKLLIYFFLLQYETLVTIVTQLKEAPREVTFDLARRAEYRHPERMERTVFVSPLSMNTTPDMIKVSLVLWTW